ncbi:FAD/NAD(P)-binding domain-containing protein [Coniophora puteana RWD-64-598 SS2]|uniref:FAD/NAD(P)-binding domain-containing protein n=1 Tax=Coniophora puteana (strain RWD-64-598) TaxID=741705 RepID=A0A5M3MA81_CONPW|nr:FAD/NAD(P)-binding domain-containing protein [Coniophora puteana RWD-64-598 SS2]EIW75856.1 FAD/NAD(P)-binding domain-containing protein [Coniophora puteana RWD-64-598 SS2]
MSSQIPEKTQVLVIGGGPGGSYAAACLAQEGLDVVVLEADKFPRYHIGESMLASLRHFLRFVDLESVFEEHGFQKKAGAAFKFNATKREGYTDFVSRDPGNYSWNVVRSQADELMFRHAAKCGAVTLDGVKVTSVEWDQPSPAAGEPVPSGARPIAASWKTRDGATGRIAFDYVVDASGRAGILSTQYLKNRKLNNSLKNVACWAYWEGDGIGKYSPGTTREGSPFFEALSDESGWCWFIPLHDGTTSVGLVIDQEISNKKKAELRAAADPSIPEGLLGHYLTELKLAPRILELIADGKLIASKDGAATVRSASDYSYSGSSYAGPGYRIVGDAGAFIDPYFSSGVHLALSSGLSAAATISASIKGDVSETDAAEWHTAKVGTGYTRFLFVVWSAYRQIRSQSVPVLSDVDEDNFDRAFAHFRPVIQGNADVGKDMSESELQATIEFCTQAYVEPSSPEERAAVKARVGDLKIEEAVKALDGNLSAVKNASAKHVNGINSSMNGNGSANGVVGNGNADMEGLDEREKRIAVGMTARKVMRSEDIEHIDNFIKDELNGYRIKLIKGSLSLEKA